MSGGLITILLGVVPVPDWAAAAGLGLVLTASTAAMRVIVTMSRQIAILEQQVEALTRSNTHLADVVERTARSITRLEVLAERDR